jgi:hypothetical protein
MLAVPIERLHENRITNSHLLKGLRPH